MQRSIKLQDTQETEYCENGVNKTQTVGNSTKQKLSFFNKQIAGGWR